MHQLVLITAMSATTGLFGGGKHCGGGKMHQGHGRAVSACSSPATPAAATCGASAGYGMAYAAPTQSYSASPQAYPSVQGTPAQAMPAAPADAVPPAPSVPPAPAPPAPPAPPGPAS